MSRIDEIIEEVENFLDKEVKPKKERIQELQEIIIKKRRKIVKGYKNEQDYNLNDEYIALKLLISYYLTKAGIKQETFGDQFYYNINTKTIIREENKVDINASKLLELLKNYKIKEIRDLAETVLDIGTSILYSDYLSSRRIKEEIEEDKYDENDEYEWITVVMERDMLGLVFRVKREGQGWNVKMLDITINYSNNEIDNRYRMSFKFKKFYEIFKKHKNKIINQLDNKIIALEKFDKMLVEVIK